MKKNNFLLSVLLAVIFTTQCQIALSQCTNCGSNYPGGTFTNTSASWTSVSSGIWGSEWAYYTLDANYLYQWQSSGNWDSQFTLYPSATCGSGYSLAYNDDGGSANGSWINYSPGTTSVRMLVSQFNCTSNSTSTTVQWRAIPKTPAISGGDVTICIGSSVSLTASNIGNNDDYVDVQWGTSSGGTDISADATSVTVSPATTTTYYLRYALKNYDGGDLLYSNVAQTTITVNPTSVANETQSPASGSSVCQGATITYTGSGTGAFQRHEYQWGGTGGAWSTYSGSNPATWGATPGTLYMRSIYKSGVCSEAASSPVVVYVDAAPVGASSISVSATSLCDGSSLTVTRNGAITGTDRWWMARDGVQWAEFGDLYAGSSSWTRTMTAPGSNASYTYYVYHHPINGACGWHDWDHGSTSPTVTVYTSTIIGSISGGTSPICFGSSTGTMSLSGNRGSVVRWERQLGAGGWTNIATTSTSYSEIPSSAGTWYYRAYVQNGPCSGGYTNTITIQVDAPSNAGSVTQSPSSGGTVCAGNGVTYTQSGGTGAFQYFEYQWNGTGGAWSGSWGTTNPYTWTSSLNGASVLYVRAVKKNGVCAAAVTSPVNITVQSSANSPGAISLSSNSVCAGTAVTVANTTSATTGTPVSAGPYYKFYYNINGAGWVSWQDGATATATVPAIVTNTVGSHQIARNSYWGCAGEVSATYQNLAVYQSPGTATVGGTQNICGLTSGALGGNAITVGTASWSKVSGPGTVTFSAVNSGSSTATVSAYGTYVLRWTFPANVSCPGSSADITVNYYQSPGTATVGGTQNICGLTSGALGGNAITVGTASWSKVSGPGTVTFSAVNNGSSTATVSAYGTYVLRWTFPANVSCPGSSADITVNYYATPTASAGGSQAICVLGTATVSGASSSNGSILWTENGAGSITLGATTLTPTYTSAAGDAGNTVTLTMSVSNAPCTAATADYTVVVNANNSAGAASSTPTLCVNTPLPAITHITTGATGIGAATGLPAGVTAVWASNTITISGTPTVSGTYNYTIPLTGGCGNANATGTITVNPIPTVTPAAIPTSTCIGTSATLSASSPVSGASFSWMPGSLSGSPVSVAPLATTNYTVTSNALGCTANATIAVTVIAPTTTGLSNGDYVWSGNTSTNWNAATNWLIYGGGSTFSFAGAVPDGTKNVFIRANGSCVTNAANVIASSAGSCKNLIIEPTTSLTMGNPSSLNVAGNWTNQGTFNCGTGTVTFNGSANQTIVSGGYNFYNVTINNSAAGNSDINLSDPLVISGIGTFTDGIVNYSGTGSLTFSNGASCNGGSASSFVNGVITKSGSNAFTFPTGDVSSGSPIWAPIGIAAPATSSTITAQYKFDVPHDDGGNIIENYNSWMMCNPAELHHASGVEYWKMTSDNAEPAVTLYWKDASRSQITYLPDLCVAHYEDCDGAGPGTDVKWANKGGDPNAVGTLGVGGSGSVTSTISFNSYSPVTFGTKNSTNPLPINLLSFKAVCENNKVDITWSTATETNNDYFTIQRSVDASGWEFVKSISGGGNSNSKLHYSAIDTDPLNGTSYYRLKQTDYNGQSETFSPVAVICGDVHDKQSISYYPNPFTSEVMVDLQNINFEKAVLTIYNLLGEKVYEMILTSNESIYQEVKMDLHSLPAGVYSVTFASDGYSSSSKIVKNY